MASVEKTKSGGWLLRFYLDGKQRKVSFPSMYRKSDVLAAANAVDGFLRARKLDEPLDRATRAYFDSAPDDLIKRFRALGFGLRERNASRTVEEAFNEYVEYKSKFVKENTLLIEKAAFERVRSAINVGELVSSLRSSEVIEAFSALQRIYSSATMSLTKRELVQFGAYCVNNGYAKTNAWVNEFKWSAGASQTERVSREDSLKVLDALPSWSAKAVFAMCRFVGLRKSEPYALTADSFDFDARKVRIFASKTERYKDSGYRVAPMEEVVVDTIREYMNRTNEDSLFKKELYSDMIRRAAERCGVKMWKEAFQSLRTTRENEWILEGYPSFVVAKWIGHSVRTQEKYYLKVLDEYYHKASGLA